MVRWRERDGGIAERSNQNIRGGHSARKEIFSKKGACAIRKTFLSYWHAAA
jgi:hypothetical protein